ncbi:hypothetical protein BO86DRAFT_191589 [Aspergillus japonicus CBS 114.51]|uniref:Uncharacterized protein n=1 Tax=Aspergillus japonicus CBS 114.51 TaxID=1448312 RepID=A0A8T8XBL1_ASPJA|nr:hypothetical protein BO86DRAFT_191589 [Aspergillus japonicus CBS 114.51]RAH85475.1 hypothetical protein BO86DRAFT_191589 [Aspergillus japonicus CBS 114.51]
MSPQSRHRLSMHSQPHQRKPKVTMCTVAKCTKQAPSSKPILGCARCHAQALALLPAHHPQSRSPSINHLSNHERTFTFPSDTNAPHLRLGPPQLQLYPFQHGQPRQPPGTNPPRRNQDATRIA